jgi:hypothetical protein
MLRVLANRTCRHLFFAQALALVGTGLLTALAGEDCPVRGGAAITLRWM